MKSLWKWFFVTFTLVMCLDILFDIGKWALGRYTEIIPWLSILMIIGFSALLAGTVEMIHHLRRTEEKHYQQYLHHKVKVWVTGKQKGEHWKSSLCPGCEFFAPDSPGNCLIESVVHTTSRDNHLVLVVWECPKFKRRKL